MPLRKESYNQVKGLIESIENDRNADVFREPVDWEGKFTLWARITLSFDTAFVMVRNGLVGLPANC